MSEIDEIKLKYSEGKLDYIKRDLEIFIRNNRKEIQDYQLEFNKKNPSRQIDEELAIKFFILHCAKYDINFPIMIALG